MGHSRKVFTKKFKVDAVKLITEQGYKISEAARNLEIDPSNLRCWQEQVEKEGTQAFLGKGYMTPEKEELHWLHWFIDYKNSNEFEKQIALSEAA